MRGSMGAKAALFLAAVGTAVPAHAGRYCGPYTVIPHTTYRVAGSTPECVGQVNSLANDVADLVQKHGGAKGNQYAGMIVDGGNFLRKYGLGNETFQTNANCVPVCVAFPKSEQVVKEDIYWDPNGGMPNLTGTAYYKSAYGQWGPGPGWHRIDPIPIQYDYGTFNMYCHIFSNWSGDTNRSAIQCVDTQ